MKRLVSAAVLAAGCHALLFSLNHSGLTVFTPGHLSTTSVTVTLNPLRPPAAAPPADLPPADALPRPVATEKQVAKTLRQPEKPPTEPDPQPAETKKAIQQPKKVKPVAAKEPQPVDEATSERSLTATAPAPPPPEASAAPVSSSSAPGPGSGEMTSAPPSTTAPAGSSSMAADPGLREAQPEYSKNPPLEYPRRARTRGYQGTVVLEVLVDRHGKVNDIRILSSSGHTILDSSAMNSVRSWSFEPGRKGPERVEMWVRVPVRFKLE